MRWLVVKVSQLFFRGMWLIFPYLIWFIGFLSRLILTAVISLIIGIPESIHRIADEQTQHAIQAGLPTLHARHYNTIIRVVAFILILVGWIGFAFIAVFIMVLIS